MKPAPQIECVDLHDSCFELIERNGNEMLLKFDWTIMDNYTDDNVFEPLIQDCTTILLKGVRQEIMTSFCGGAEILLNNSLCNMANSRSKISKYYISDAEKSIQLMVEYSLNDHEYTTCWKFKYDSYEIGCQSYSKLADWMNKHFLE